MMPMKKKNQLLLSLPLLMITSISWADRSGFYTILGPDGHIIVIDRNAAEPKQPVKNQVKQLSTPSIKQSEVATVTPVQPALSIPVNTNSKLKVESNGSIEPSPVVVKKESGQTPVAAAKNNNLSTHSQPVSAVQAQPIAQQPTNSPAQQPTKAVNAVGSTVSNTPKAPVVPISVPVVQSSSAAVENNKNLTVIDANSEAQKNNPVTIINGEKYIESEYLEEKEFNLEGKKRFYSLPDGLGGNQVVEREKGLDMSVFRGPQIKVPKVVTLSKDYQRVPAQNIVALTGTQCFAEKQLEKTKPIKENITTDFWPKPSFEPKFDFVVAKFEQAISDIEFTSYANTIKKPKFYWPLPIFLDSKGCVLEGVNAFYLRTLLPTISQHEAIQGYLHVPEGAKYLLLTPLEAAADLDHIQLTNQGQIRLTPIR